MKRESLSSQSLSKKWCFLDCESRLGTHPLQSSLTLTSCSLSNRYNCRPVLQDRPCSGVCSPHIVIDARSIVYILDLILGRFGIITKM